MTPEFWIAFATFAFVIMTTTIGAAVYIGRTIGQLDGQMRKHTDRHAARCANYDPSNTAPRLRVAEHQEQP